MLQDERVQPDAAFIDQAATGLRYIDMHRYYIREASGFDTFNPFTKCDQVILITHFPKKVVRRLINNLCYEHNCYV